MIDDLRAHIRAILERLEPIELEPGSHHAKRQGCTCEIEQRDADYEVVVRDKWCSLHGRDPDDARDEMMERDR